MRMIQIKLYTYESNQWIDFEDDMNVTGKDAEFIFSTLDTTKEKDVRYNFEIHEGVGEDDKSHAFTIAIQESSPLFNLYEFCRAFTRFSDIKIPQHLERIIVLPEMMGEKTLFTDYLSKIGINIYNK